VESKSHELVNNNKERIDNKRIEKNSKKLSFCKEKLLEITNDDIRQLKTNKSLITLLLSSFKKRKFGKKDSIFKFKKRKKTQSKIKNVCPKTSLSIIGELKFRMLIKREL
jgi:hypothetical protein